VSKKKHEHRVMKCLECKGELLHKETNIYLCKNPDCYVIELQRTGSSGLIVTKRAAAL